MATKESQHYCPAEVTEANRRFDERLRARYATMDLKKWKTIKLIIANAGIPALIGYAVAQGGDPTLVPTLGLIVLGGINGMEAAEILGVLADAADSRRNGSEGGSD